MFMASDDQYATTRATAKQRETIEWLTRTHDRNAVGLGGFSVHANVLNDGAGLQDGLHLAQADVLAELKFNLNI